MKFDREDFYFDRLVPLTLNVTNPITNKNFTNVALGVLVSKDQVLTSFNPFRTILNNKTLFESLVATVNHGRSKNGSRFQHLAYRFKITCGRQLQYLPDENIPDHLWHGTDRRNSPLHDLMVFRLLANLEPANDTNNFTIEAFSDDKVTIVDSGVFLTKIANRSDSLGAYFKFATLGLTNEDITKYRRLKIVEYEPDDNAEVNCDEWFPREWGYFICILNKGNYPGVSSGAMLVSDFKVFGVGSFAMFRGERGILAFTDVRPYSEHINNTCTYEDSGQKIPDQFPEPS